MKEVDYTLNDGYLDFSYKSPGPCKLVFETVTDAMKHCRVSEGKAVFNGHQPNISSKKKKKKEVIELSEETKRDLEILKMRSVFDPKHFYKKDKSLGQIKNVEIGRVIDSPADYYSSRLPKKLRKKTLVDELLADAEFQKRNKRKFLEIIEQKKRTNARAHRYARVHKKLSKR